MTIKAISAVFLLISMISVLYVQASALNDVWNAVSQLPQSSQITYSVIKATLQFVGFILLFVVLWLVLILLDKEEIVEEKVSKPKSHKTKFTKDTLPYEGICGKCGKRIDKDEFKRNSGICDDCWDTSKMKEDGLS